MINFLWLIGVICLCIVAVNYWFGICPIILVGKKETVDKRWRLRASNSRRIFAIFGIDKNWAFVILLTGCTPKEGDNLERLMSGVKK